MNMGVPAFNIASSIILITGQRLARRLCVCKQVGTFSPSMLTAAGFNEADSRGQWRTYVPIGCDKCKGSGYKGRVGIYQVMPITEAMQSIILANGSALDIERQARAEGVLSLRESGLEKVKQGVTSIEEVLAVTNV
jgi:type IV pilus assembly protein PilB